MPLYLFKAHFTRVFEAPIVRIAAFNFDIIDNFSENMTYLFRMISTFAGGTSVITHFSNLNGALTTIYVLAFLAL